MILVDGDAWMCVTLASLVSFLIAHRSRTSMPSYASWLTPQAFCSSVFIPPGTRSPPVESSGSASLATRRNSFQYSVTDVLPCLYVFSLILASPLATITPNSLCSSALNPAHVYQVVVLRSSAYGEIHVPASSLRRLVAYQIFPLSWPLSNPTVL